MSGARIRDDKPALVLLHGWGAHAGVWGELALRLGADVSVQAPDLPGHGTAPALATADAGELIDQLAAAAPVRCMVAGWSLGAQLALAWAHRHPQQVAGLVLLAATPRFVGATDWPHGMAAADFARFAASLEHDPAGTLRRFRLLQTQGDAHAREVLRRFDAALAERPMPAPQALKQTLDWLRITDLRNNLPGIGQPVLVLHGAEDRLAPAAAAEFLTARLPQARLELLDGVAHVPFVSAADFVCAKIAGFCRER